MLGEGEALLSLGFGVLGERLAGVVRVGGGSHQSTCGGRGGIERKLVMAEGGETTSTTTTTTTRTTTKLPDDAVVVGETAAGAATGAPPNAEPPVEYSVDELLALHQELIDSMLAEVTPVACRLRCQDLDAMCRGLGFVRSELGFG